MGENPSQGAREALRPDLLITFYVAGLASKMGAENKISVLKPYSTFTFD